MAARGGGEGGRGYPHFECTKTIDGDRGYVSCVLLGKGRLVITGGMDSNIRVLNADTYELSYVLKGHKEAVWSLALVPDTDFLASGGRDGSIIIFDLSTRKLSHSLPGGHSGCVMSLLTVPGTTLLVSCSHDKAIKVWDVVTRTCVRTLPGHSSYIYKLANVPGNLVASGSYGGSIRVWNPATGTCVRTIARAHDGMAVLCVVYVPGVDLLASGGGDGSIKLWDVTTGECKATFTDAHSHYVRSLAVIPGTALLASCSDDKTVKVWDVTTGKCVQTLLGHGSYVLSIAVDPSTDSLLSVSSDKTLKVWTNLKAASARRRYCVLACLSSLTAKLYAGEEYGAGAVKKPVRDEVLDEDEDVKGGGGEVGGGRLQGVLAFDRITSADVWRYILEFV